MTPASRLFSLRAAFVGSAVAVGQAPAVLPPQQPEIAFIGRSNCGKSSLINALLGVRRLVKTSKRPGKTAMLNFFVVGERLTLTDMPGYGFGSRAEWGPMVLDYLRQRQQLRITCLLIDSRRGVLPIDEQTMDLLDEAHVPFQVVLTKSDLVAAGELAALAQSVPAALAARPRSRWVPPVLAVSAHSQSGLDELREALFGHCFAHDEVLPLPSMPAIDARDLCKRHERAPRTHAPRNADERRALRAREAAARRNEPRRAEAVRPLAATVRVLRAPSGSGGGHWDQRRR